MLRGFALSRQVLAQLRCANNVVYFVEQVHCACSTKYTKSGERLRRSQALVMGIGHALNKMAHKVVYAVGYGSL
jgi:hypothetical protein